MLFTNILPEAICCCLETFNVYVVLLTLFCIIVHKTFMLTPVITIYCLRLFVIVYKHVMFVVGW